MLRYSTFPSKPKRKMAGILTYEMGYLVWDPSPSGGLLNNYTIPNFSI